METEVREAPDLGTENATTEPDTATPATPRKRTPRTRKTAKPQPLPMMTSREVMDYLRISRTAIARYRKAGKLLGEQLPGGQWRYWREGLLAPPSLPQPERIGA